MELTELGGILFSNPLNEDDPTLVHKFHLCQICYNKTVLFIGTKDDEIRRADQYASCEVCNRFYRDHDDADDILSNEGEPYLKRLCNGDLVKL